jgi:DNA-binding transcriptional MocR family regulator
MHAKLARRMDWLRASDIREMLKVTQRPDMISLAGGLPAPEIFPVAELAEAAARILRERGGIALQYATSEGHLPLREKIAARMNRIYGTDFAAAEILVTTGSQQALDLTAKLFLDEGDAVLCESPTYLAAIQAFDVFHPRWVEVATDDDGMDPEALAAALAANPQAKLVYVIPNSQNPSGRTWTLARRERFMEIVARHPVTVVEDNPYGEICYDGEPLPSLASLDRQGQVICLGTFSKTVAPGLRVGWLAVHGPLFGKLTILKGAADLHTSTFGQLVLDAYLEGGSRDANILRTRTLYRERRDAMLAALAREMPAGVRFTRPAGGLFIWLELPAGLDARALLPLCLERGVAFVPGGGFFPNGTREDTARLNFSNMPAERIVEGVRRLAEAMRELQARRAAPGAAVTRGC